MSYYNNIMTDSDLIQNLFKMADPAKAELVTENARLRAENHRLLTRVLRLERERAEREQQTTRSRPYLRRFVFHPSYQNSYVPSVEIFETLNKERTDLLYVLKAFFL